MESINWQDVTIAVLTILSSVGGWIIMKRGKESASGKPPPERPITLHDSKVALKELTAQINHNQDIVEKDHAMMLRSLSTLEEGLRHIERNLPKSN